MAKQGFKIVEIKVKQMESDLCIPVKDIMHKKVITIKPESKLIEAAKVLSSNKIGSLVVVYRGKVVGVLTDKDIINAVAKGKIGVRVEDVMLKEPITIDPDEMVIAADNIIKKNDLKCIPVTKKGKLVGLITVIRIIDYVHSKESDRLYEIALKNIKK